jgi:hypothetical protein
MKHTLWLFVLPLSIVSAVALIADAAWGQIDYTKNAVVLPFESSTKVTPGFLDVARDTVIAFLKEDKTFATVLDPAEASAHEKSSMIEIGATLVEFKAGSMATRVLVGLGSGRASAAFEFTIKDMQTGDVIWKKRIKEKASVWSNSASSTAQRQELPEKIAKKLIKELHAKKN